MKNDVSELRKLVRDLLEEMSVRITDRSDSSMPEWERKAEKLGCYDKSTAISHAPKGRFLFAQGVKDNFCHISFNMDDGKIINLQIPDFQLEKMVDNLERVSKSTF